jgi:hypothetical protein
MKLNCNGKRHIEIAQMGAAKVSLISGIATYPRFYRHCTV